MNSGYFQGSGKALPPSPLSQLPHTQGHWPAHKGLHVEIKESCANFSYSVIMETVYSH